LSAAWETAGLVLVAATFGAGAASAFWWWLMPAPLLARWSAPFLKALERGFDEQVLEQRLRAQADGVCTRQQQERWHHDLKALHVRQQACLLAEIGRLLRPGMAATPAAAAAMALARPQKVGGSAVLDEPDLLSDAEIDALPPELPSTAQAARGCNLAGPGRSRMQSL